MPAKLHVAESNGQASPFAALRDWDRWLRARGLSEPTRRTYRAGMIAIGADLGVDPLELTEQILVNYVATLDPRGSKRDLVIKSARSFYGWAVPRGLVDANPAADLRPGKHSRGDAPCLEDDELRRVLAAAFRRDPRRGWALMLTYATGARAASMTGALVEDVHLGTATPWIHFRVAKWDRPYSVPLGRRGRIAAAQLAADARRAGRAELVGCRPTTLYDWARQAGEESGLKVWAHLLRHTYATRLAEDPAVDLRTWIELMNHADASQYRRYARARADHLAAAQARGPF